MPTIVGKSGSRHKKATERRISTTDPNLFLVQVGDSAPKAQLLPEEKTPAILKRLSKAIEKPGLDRKTIFRSAIGQPVYAYFVYPADPTKIVQEDESGRQTVGQFVDGKFRSLRSTRTKV